MFELGHKVKPQWPGKVLCLSCSLRGHGHRVRDTPQGASTSTAVQSPTYKCSGGDEDGEVGKPGRVWGQILPLITDKMFNLKPNQPWFPNLQKADNTNAHLEDCTENEI